MKILILAAGYGTRLYPLVKDTPKALLEVQNKALIDHILDKFQAMADVSEVIVVTNNKFAKIMEEWAARHNSFPVKITVVNDGSLANEDRLGSIGDIDFVLRKLQINEDLLVVGSDNLFDYGLNDFVKFCKDKSPSVTIGLYDIKNIESAKKFGVVAVNSNQKIISFVEKPQQPKSSLIAMCLYYFPQLTLSFIRRYIEESKKSDTAGDYIRWLYENNHVYGFKFTGKWYDIGSIESYQEAQDKFKA